MPWAVLASLPSWDAQGQALSEKVDKNFSHKEMSSLLLPSRAFRGLVCFRQQNRTARERLGIGHPTVGTTNHTSVSRETLRLEVLH